MSSIYCLNCNFPIDKFPQTCKNCGYVNDFISNEEYHPKKLYHEFSYIIDWQNKKHTPLDIHFKEKKNGTILCYPEVSLEVLERSTEGDLIEICRKVLKDDLTRIEYKNYFKNILFVNVQEILDKKAQKLDYYDSRIKVIKFFQRYDKYKDQNVLMNVLKDNIIIEAVSDKIHSFFENLNLEGVESELSKRDSRKHFIYSLISIFKFFILRDILNLKSNERTLKYLKKNLGVAEQIGFKDKLPSSFVFYQFEKSQDLILLYQIAKEQIINVLKSMD